MTLLDPGERSARGAKLQADLTGTAATRPATLYEASLRDYIYAEVWSRPGLDLRSRFLIAMSSAACSGDSAATERYVRGALSLGKLSQVELREAALHTAVYAGWTYGGVLEELLPTPTSVSQRRARWSSAGRFHISPNTKLRMPASK